MGNLGRQVTLLHGTTFLYIEGAKKRLNLIKLNLLFLSDLHNLVKSQLPKICGKTQTSW